MSHDPRAIDVATDADVLGGLEPAQRALLERGAGSVEYPAGHVFYGPEEAGGAVYLLRRGRVRLYKLSPEGRTLTLLLLEPPAVFGEMALVEGWHHDSFAECVTDCAVGVLAAGDVRRLLATEPGLALRFMTIMSRRLQALERKLADIAFRSVPQRLAAVLLGLAGQPQSGAPVMVRYTHQQLAEMIGSYRETVTKAIGEFREAGLIRVEEEAIHLTDLPRLHQLAGEPR